MGDGPGHRAADLPDRRSVASNGAPLVEDSSDAFDSLLRDAVEITEPSSIDASPVLDLAPGDVLSERFVVEWLAGAGGMGKVHHGRDLRTGRAVAIKVIARTGRGHARRFAQEAVMLAELSHPAIVEYVAHGTTPRGMPFLAMEWLEGEDLSKRIGRCALTVEESFMVARRACEAIAVAHTRGVVHRDLKPSNLFLVNKDPSLLKVLDFGIARQKANTPPLTASGTILGTVGYMAPEQARAARDVDARADVFALGSVLFECLAGRPAFAGQNPVAILAKVLCEEPPHLRTLRPDVSEAAEALVARMLAKNPGDRPADASAVLSALAALEPIHRGQPPAGQPSERLTGGEQRIVSVILGQLGVDRVRPGPPVARGPVDATLSRLRKLADEWGADCMVLRGGAVLVVFASRAAIDQAAQAARYALLLRSARSDLRLAVASGSADTTGSIPVGAVIDRAAALLNRTDAADDGIPIDDMTVGLLDSCFDVALGDGGPVLLGQQPDRDVSRSLMGKTTPFVGREKELGLLELTLRECVDERVARAILITGPPGQGKSRLRQEFMESVRKQDVRVLMARADSVSAGSAFTLARQLVRRAVGVGAGDSATELGARLRLQVARVCAEGERERVADFLGELIGAAPSPQASPALRAARNDAQIMAHWLRRSFVEWLTAECAATPTVLILEDVHWGDWSSMAYVGEALRALSSVPLLLLALGRPEARDLFRDVWTGADRLDLTLGRLGRRAAARLVQQMLGQAATDDVVSQLIERADGNAFHLEELMRWVVQDRAALPPSVVALVQSRLEQFEPETRRVLRAASVFGERVRRAGVTALLGGATDPGAVENRLRALAEGEVLVEGGDRGPAGETVYGFRHALLREAAYAMLTDGDRVVGHRLAAEWLEDEGDEEALAIADHFERGERGTRAVPWLLRAARAAADGSHIDAAILLCGRALGCGAQGEDRGHLRLLQSRALLMRADLSECTDAARDAMESLAPGSGPWFEGASTLLLCGSFSGDLRVILPALQAVLQIDVPAERSGPRGCATYFAIQGLAQAGQIPTAHAYLARAEEDIPDEAEEDPAFRMWLRIARAFLRILNADLGRAFSDLGEARALADRAGAPLGRLQADIFWLSALAQTGCVERAETASRELLSFCEPASLNLVAGWTTFFLAWTRVATGLPREAVDPLRELLARGDPFLVVSARGVLSQALLALGDPRAAEREIRALGEDTLVGWKLASALRSRALVELALGQPHDALASAERGLEAAAAGSYPLTESTLRLTRAEALRALGRTDEAFAAVRGARARLLQVADTLEDSELRRCYLSRVSSHARTLDLASEWLGGETS